MALTRQTRLKLTCVDTAKTKLRQGNEANTPYGILNQWSYTHRRHNRRADFQRHFKPSDINSHKNSITATTKLTIFMLSLQSSPHRRGLAKVL